MAKGAPIGTPPRTTRIPVAGHRLHEAERWLTKSLEDEEVLMKARDLYDETPKWRLKRRRELKQTIAAALERYWLHTRQARDIANNRTIAGL